MTTETPMLITSDCWGMQIFGGLERCATCEYYPFNKNGKLLKSSQCGGGQTLAVKIYEKFRDSIYSAMKGREFWNENPKASFVEFVEWCKKEHVMQYALKKYKHWIRDLKQIAKEQNEHQDAKRLDDLYPYSEVCQKAQKIFAESWHKPHVCDCQNVTSLGAYRDEAYTLEDGTIVWYYHQHAIVAKTLDGKMILDSCSWRTITTKERINRYLPRGWYLYSINHVWKLTRQLPYKRNHKKSIPFYDGITIEVYD